MMMMMMVLMVVTLIMDYGDDDGDGDGYYHGPSAVHVHRPSHLGYGEPKARYDFNPKGPA
eukprot:9466214-Pyramimonas_sp.AAC.1